MPSYFAELEPAVTDRLVAAIARVMAISDDPQLPGFLALVAPVSRGEQCRALMRELLAPTRVGPYAAFQLALGAGAAGDSPMACDFFAAAEIGLREQGRLGVLYRALITHAMHATYLGDARTTSGLHPEGAAIATEIGERSWVFTAVVAAGAAAALAGDLAQAEERAAVAEAVYLPLGRNPLLAGVRQIRGYAALAAGRPAEAFAELRRIFDPADDSFHPGTGHLLIGFLVEAAAGCGATGELRALVRELTPVRSPIVLAGLGLARAVLEDTAEAYEKMLGEELTRWPFEQARRQHMYGAWLRRRRRPAESRPLLRAAAATFDALSATAWAERSRAELRASGESLRRPGSTGLTPQETQIARLAAAGLSNQEIADRLVLSPRTVTTHLSRIYPKLGIRSRVELARALRIT